MQKRQAEHLVWTLKEVIDLLVQEAKRNGAVVPPTYDSNITIAMDAQNSDGSKGAVQLTIIAPLGWPPTEQPS